MEKKYNFEEYRNFILTKLRMEYGYDVVQEVEVLKNNHVKLKGISFRAGTNSASPVIYFDHDKDCYTDQDVERFVENAKKHFEDIRKFSENEIRDIFDWETVKQNIYPKLINYEKNQELLSDTPCVRFLDLAVVFFFVTSKVFPELGKGAVTVKNHMKKRWAVNEEQLMEVAMDNLKAQKCILKNVEELFALYGLDEEEGVKTQLHVLTAYNGINGAAAVLNSEFLDTTCEELSCQKIWVIPSSVHETLILPYDNDSEAKELFELCVGANKMLYKEDYLADTLYYYDSESKQLQISRKAEENGQT